MSFQLPWKVFIKNPAEIKASQQNNSVKLPEEWSMKYVTRSIRNLRDIF